DHPGFAVVTQLVEHRRVVADDAALVRTLPVEVPQPIEMRVLAYRPPKILPHASQERVALGFRLFGEGHGEVPPPDPVVLCPRSDPSHQACGQLRRPDRIEPPDEAQQPNPEDAGDDVPRRVEAPAQPANRELLRRGQFHWSVTGSR